MHFVELKKIFSIKQIGKNVCIRLLKKPGRKRISITSNTSPLFYQRFYRHVL